MPFRSAILAGINLVRNAIQSPNYVPGVSGWKLSQDGSAEFTGIIITSGGLIQLSGATTTTTLFTTIVNGDAFARFNLNADGGISWGDGVNPADTNLYRGYIQQLQTDSRFAIGRPSNTDTALSVAVNGDANDRYVILSTGEQRFGPGSAPYDVALRRSGVGALRADGAFSATGALSALAGLAVTGAATVSSTLGVSGLLTASAGLAVSGAPVAVTRAAAADDSVTVRVSGDTQPRGTWNAGGSVEWGPGGATVPDTFLRRTAAATLSTDNDFAVGEDLTISGVGHGRGVWNATAMGGSAVTGVTTTETAIITTGSITFKAGRAYEVCCNAYSLSTVAGDIPGFQLRKTNALGTSIHSWFDEAALTRASQNSPFFGRKIMRVGASDVTTALCLTGVRRNGTGTFTFNTSNTQNPYIEVRDIGDASDYSSFFAIT